MLLLENISKTFSRSKSDETKVLEHFSLRVEKHEFLTIIGANGSGKSTLLNVISGNVVPDQGHIYLEDKAIETLPDYRRSKWIARVFQDPLSGTVPELSILDNFRLAALRGQPKKLSIGIDDRFKRKVKARLALLDMGLENKIEQPVGSLSGGQRQALTILMTVMTDVKLLLLDEPTAALDPRSAHQVMVIAKKLVAEYKLTVLLITHNMNEALNYGDRLVQLAEGKIKRDFNAQEKQLLKPQDLFQWFNEL
ncbi:ATP-binding cassette domain-containing protein [Olivibacter sp. SDN3]|uniref:ABC transporter ATP-binding protein n=1 Tax=Olivibacter sp. SDN3 TaxID=2764720 RepID=UPI0016518CC8|nr:ATP-binding cassette domain-containing protein [Olivibacter sp. SDN3]QNL48514.1 ATP-binding cassette domain-containing protein [Olivibacter sp. SDN3]